MTGIAVPRPEYPRPQQMRAQWQNLNGVWQFAYDPNNEGVQQKWFAGGHLFEKTIVVPFCVESTLSGIGDRDFHDIVWYQRPFTIPTEWQGQDIHLNIGACDFETHLYVNGRLAGYHRGGYTPIQVDVTPYLHACGVENTLTVRAYDKGNDRKQPRGKQDWRLHSHAIWYTRCTGIWQTVWLEPVPRNHIAHFELIPEFDQKELHIRVETSQFVTGATLTVTVQDKADGHQTLARETLRLRGNRARISLPVPTALPWSPEAPHLYPVTLTLKSEGGTDSIHSYFGMRKVEGKNGKVYLNNQPYFLKMVLDQGYWPDGIYTAPTDDALKFDIEVAKQMGFNGARKHQKAEDPRWLYWADTLGYVTWGETGSNLGYTATGCANFRIEWPEVVARDFNHPCLIAWVPFNESWGIEGIRDNVVIQEYVRDIVSLTKQLDPTRLVIANDGWEQIDDTDLLTVHDYEQNANKLHNRWSAAGSRRFQPQAFGSINSNGDAIVPLAEGQRYNGQPILITEFGGIAYSADVAPGKKDWGYGKTALTQQQFVTRLASLNRALLAIPGLAGYVYTQLTDVEQEINGLLTYDRRPKAPLEVIRRANQVWHVRVRRGLGLREQRVPGRYAATVKALPAPEPLHSTGARE